MTYTVASLFAGIGGIDLGFEQAGARPIWANEIDQKASETYRSNFKHPLITEDIRKISADAMPDVDILTAGWPCVAFSVAGRRHGMQYECSGCKTEHTVTYDQYINGATCPACHSKTEPKDPRGTLFYDVIRFIRAKNPSVIFLENVKNLTTHDKGNTFKIVKSMLVDSGYHIKYKVLNTMSAGNIPQNRERIFIAGFKEKAVHDTFEFPGGIRRTQTLHDILDISHKQPGKYYYDKNSRYYDMLSAVMHNPDTAYQLRRTYVRENKSNVCPTLTANMGTGGHNVPLIIDPWGFRKITPREALRLQGFPDSHRVPAGMADSHVYKQAGNAVSVPVIKRIASNITDALNAYKGGTKP